MKRSPAHPGVMLELEYLKPLKVSVEEFAKRIHAPVEKVKVLIKNKNAKLDAELALRFAKFFDTTPEYWLNLQQNYDLYQAKKTFGIKIDRQIKPFAIDRDKI